MVADTYSTDGVGVLLMGTGNDNNSWGDNANTSVFQIIMDALANVLTSAVTGGTLTLSASPPPAATSQTRYAALKFTGILSSNQTVQVPNLNKWWLVCNATSGAFTLKFKTPSGSASTAIPQNSGWQMVRCDGSNVMEVWPFNTAQIQMPDGAVGAPAYSNLTEPTSGWWRAGTQDWRLSINGVDVLKCTGTGASSPSIINVLSPNALQVNGVAVFVSGSTIKAADGTVGAPGFTFNSEATSGLYRIGAGNVGFSILGVKVGEWSATAYTLAQKLAVTNTTVAASLAGGTTAQRSGGPTAGDTRYNTSFNGLEYYNGTAWIILGQPVTVQRFTSGSGTCTPSTGVVRWRVTLVGPGGGGGGAAGSTNNGANGAADTSFGSWTAVKGNGGGAGLSNGGVGGAGGTGGATGTGTLINRVDGQRGTSGSKSVTSGTTIVGGNGGNSTLAGAGAGRTSDFGGGQNAAANSGSGGSGCGASAGPAAAGGGAGETVVFWVNNPTATSYAVGAKGAGGLAGGGSAGGDGGDGLIVVEEFYH